MLIGYRPAGGDAWALDAGSDTASFVTSSDFLTDARVSKATRIQWNVSSPGIFNTLELFRTIPAANIRAMALLGLVGIPAGVLIEFSAVGGDAADASIRTVELPDGSVAAWVAFPPNVGAGSTIIEYRIMNDLNGAPWNSGAAVFDIGEVVYGIGFDLQIQPNAKEKPLNDSGNRRATNGNTSPLPRRDYRSLVVDLVPAPYAVAYGPQDGSWAQIRGTIAKSRPMFVIPSYRGETGAIDNAKASMLGLFGWCSNRGEIDYMKDTRRYTWSPTFEEYPPSTA